MLKDNNLRKALFVAWLMSLVYVFGVVTLFLWIAGII